MKFCLSMCACLLWHLMLMEQKRFFYIQISYKLWILCETHLSAEDQSFIKKTNNCAICFFPMHFTWSLLLYIQPINKLTSQCEIRALWIELTTNNTGLSFDMSTGCMDRCMNKKNLLMSSSKSSRQTHNWFSQCQEQRRSWPINSDHISSWCT